MKAGFTLVEIIIVVIIIGILTTLAMPQYAKIQEKALDNEAKANLVLIQAAENLYKIESSAFYAASGADLNSALSVSLPPAGGKWNYSTETKGVAPLDTVCFQATRNVESGRSWHIMNIENAPSTGACP